MSCLHLNPRNFCKLFLYLALMAAAFSSRATVNSEFIEAATLGDIRRVQRLLTDGANINAWDSRGMTALHASAAFGFNSAQANKQAYMVTQKYIAVIKFLLAHGADINSLNESGMTPLYIAASYGFKDAAELLIESGAKVDTRTFDGDTPLIAASRYLDVLKLLISKGADINAKGDFGWTVLHKSSAFDEFENYVKFLLDHGADPNARRFDDQTPLHHAAESGAEKISVLLISYGADVDARDKYGNRPYDLARRRGNSDYYSLFEKPPVNTKPSSNCIDELKLNKVEWYVCRFPILTAIDSKLNDVYASALKVANRPTYLREEQRDWIRERNHLCQMESHKCSITKLIRMYEERIDRLGQIATDPMVTANSDICKDMAMLAGKAEIAGLAVRTYREPTEPELAYLEGISDARPSSIFEFHPSRSSKSEKFGMFNTGGSCASRQLFNLRILMESKGESNGWVDVGDTDDIVRWAYWGGGDTPIKYQENYYVVTSDLADENHLNMVSSIKSDGTIRPICTVEQSSIRFDAQPRANSLCSSIADGAVKPIIWKILDTEFVATREEFVEKFSTYADSIEIATIDIDGDGIV